MILPEIAILGVMIGLLTQATPSQSEPQHLHVRNTFAFDLRESLEKTAPLFGAHRERDWAEGWDPQFVFPQPAEDRQGSVFQVKKGSHDSTWINTIFDPRHIQYVYFIPEVMAVLIDIRLSPTSLSGTHVEVTYERTALKQESNDHIRHLGEQDAKSGEEWRTSIEGYFERRKAE
jgi:hypothetical protein